MMKRSSHHKGALFTIGYEGRNVAQMLERITSVGVTVLVDVRYRAHSRKPGFSRVRLEAACASAGVRYLHVPELGTPPVLMRRFGPGGYDPEAFEDYRRFLRLQDRALEATRQLIATATCCLMCYESDATTCHRHIVADELQRLAAKTTVTHL